jgi:hypothetical protein
MERFHLAYPRALVAIRTQILRVLQHHPQSTKELRMTQAMNLRMFFGVAWLLIGLAWGYWSLSRNENANLRHSGTFLLLGSLALIFSFLWK